MKHKFIVIFALFISVSAIGQPRKIKKSRVNLSEKQNKPASAIPTILIDAYSRGEIKAYYPNSLKHEVPFAQFLHHFGMRPKAQRQLAGGQPFWFCADVLTVKVDKEVMDCMNYSFEIGEEVFRNNITYQQDKRMIYVKVIYSKECSTDGIEKEGPIFRMSDIKKLNEREHKIVNSQNSAVSYTIADYLALGLVHGVPYR